MPKNKFYVVWNGRKKGIFDTWETCKEQIDGFEGAQYKSFPTENAAREAFAKNYWQTVKAAQQPQPLNLNLFNDNEVKPIPESLSVDAACSGNPGLMEYRGVWTATGQEAFRLGPFEAATNNIGEFLAIVHGLALLKQHQLKQPIYSDSVTAQAWVKAKKCKTKLQRTVANSAVFELIERAETWLANNSYTTKILKWETTLWGEIPADFGRKG